MTNFWGTKETLNWTVDNLIQGEKMDSFGDCKEADITELFKRCFDLADQLFDQTLVQREVHTAACDRLKGLIEKICEKPEQTAAAPYYHLARGNVRFRQALILNRWKPLPYSMCQEAQTCFEEAQKAEDSVCRWLAQHMAAKCEREMEKFRYHHSSSPSFQRGEGALKAFERIVKEIPSDNGELGRITLDAVINMGRCLRNQMKHQEAIPYFAAVCEELTRWCDDGEGNNIIAQMESVKKYEEIDAGIKDNLHKAVEDLQQERKKDDPQYLQALVNLVSCLTDGPRAYAEAQELALHVLKNIQKENIDMQNNMGRLYRKIKSFSKAEESYQKVMENLGNARRTGASYIVDETDPLNRYAELERAKCFVRQQNYKKALEQLEWLLNFYQDDIELLLWKGLCYRNQGCLAQAVGTLQQILRTETSIRRGTVGLKARYVMGNCYLEWKDPAQAKIWFYEIWKSEPNDLLALKKYVWCQQIIGEYGEGKSNREIMDNLNQQSAEQRRNGLWGEIYNCMGRRYLHMNQDKTVTALNCFQQVLQEESGNIEALCGAACCLRRLKKNVKNIDVDFVKKLIGENETESKDFKGMAVALSKKAREVAPGNPHVESEYVLCLIRNGEGSRDEVINQVLNIDQVFPRELCVQALAELARCVERIRDEQERKNKYQAFHYLRPMKWEPAAEQVTALVDSPEFQTLEAEQQGKLLAHVYRLHHTMEQIKTTLRLKREELKEKPCWHYTRMGTMQKLLLNQGEQQPRFRLSNVAYMNDSAEGESFGKVLEQCGSAPEMLQAYGLLPGGEVPNDSSLRNVYLTSLCTADDYIYMWAIYADKGTGCSLKFDENFFDVKDSYPQGYIPFHEEKNSYPLYRIVYLTDQGKFKDRGRKLKKYLRKIKNILKDIQQEMQDIPLAYITAMLDQVRYLFKYNEYAGENEVRCLVVTRKRELAAGEGDTPYLYTEIDKEVQLDEVRFGPKVSKSPEKEAWMYATDRVKKVSYSNRHYR